MALVLCTYDYEVQHRKRTLPSNAYGLSRMPPRKCKCEECTLRVCECACIVTHSQGKGNQETLGMGSSKWV